MPAWGANRGRAGRIEVAIRPAIGTINTLLEVHATRSAECNAAHVGQDEQALHMINRLHVQRHYIVWQGQDERHGSPLGVGHVAVNNGAVLGLVTGGALTSPGEDAVVTSTPVNTRRAGAFVNIDSTAGTSEALRACASERIHAVNALLASRAARGSAVVVILLAEDAREPRSAAATVTRAARHRSESARSPVQARRNRALVGHLVVEQDGRHAALVGTVARVAKVD